MELAYWLVTFLSCGHEAHLFLDLLQLVGWQNEMFFSFDHTLLIRKSRPETHKDKEILGKHVEIEKSIIVCAAYCKHNRRHYQDRLEWKIIFYTSAPKKSTNKNICKTEIEQIESHSSAIETNTQVFIVRRAYERNMRDEPCRIYLASSSTITPYWTFIGFVLEVFLEKRASSIALIERAIGSQKFMACRKN